MIAVGLLDNPDAVRSILHHPSVVEAFLDDFTPRDFEPAWGPQVRYLGLSKDGWLAGLFVFIERSPVLWEVHTAMLPKLRPYAGIASKKALRWLWSETTCRRLYTQIPEDNAAAIRFAEAIGFKEYGRNPKSWQRRGRLLDIVQLGISKEEVLDGCCCF